MKRERRSFSSLMSFFFALSICTSYWLCPVLIWLLFIWSHSNWYIKKNLVWFYDHGLVWITEYLFIFHSHCVFLTEDALLTLYMCFSFMGLAYLSHWMWVFCISPFFFVVEWVRSHNSDLCFLQVVSCSFLIFCWLIWVCCYKDKPDSFIELSLLAKQLWSLSTKLEALQGLTKSKKSKMNNFLVHHQGVWWCFVIPLLVTDMFTCLLLYSLFSVFQFLFFALFFYWYIIVLNSFCFLLCRFKCDLCIMDYFTHWTSLFSLIVW